MFIYLFNICLAYLVNQTDAHVWKNVNRTNENSKNIFHVEMSYPIIII